MVFAEPIMRMPDITLCITTLKSKLNTYAGSMALALAACVN